MTVTQDLTLAAGLNGFVNVEVQMATVIISTILLYAGIVVMGVAVNVPQLAGEIVNNAINIPHAHLLDYTRLLSGDGLIQNTVMLDCAENPEQCLTITELKENPEFNGNSNMLHYIIVHGQVQRLLLAKFNTDGTWLILKEAIIDRETSIVEAAAIRQNFSLEMIYLCSTCSRVLDIKCSIIINHTDDIMVMRDAFLPCLDVLSRYTWHLGAICYENPELRTYIYDVSNNTQQLFGFINHLIIQIHQYDTLVLSHINQNSADNLWIIMQQASQLLRYLECIYTWYHADYVTGMNITPTEYVEFY